MRDVCNVPACHFLISFPRPCSSTIRTAHGHDFRDAELVASAFAEDGVFRMSRASSLWQTCYRSCHQPVDKHRLICPA